MWPRGPAQEVIIDNFILASSSPQRRLLLSESGYRFTVVSPTLQEPQDLHKSLTPAQQAEALAYFKARAVVESLQPDVPVLGADTVVALNNRIFGKPANPADARAMLGQLSGTRHAVITGVALLSPTGDRLIASETTYVQMRRLTDEELDAYIASEDWQGKAGGYGIQSSGDEFIDRIDGSFSNVVGLPMDLVKDLFAQLTLRLRYRGTGACP